MELLMTRSRGRGRPPKGDRNRVYPRLPLLVQEWAQTVATDNHSSISQVVADIVAIAAGHPELVRELGQEAIPTFDPALHLHFPGPPQKGPRVRGYTRLPRPVQEWAQTVATDNHSSISQVVADIVAIAAGHPELVRELGQEVTPQIA